MKQDELTPEKIVVKVWNMACAVADKPSGEYQIARTNTLEWARDEIKAQLAKSHKDRPEHCDKHDHFVDECINCHNVCNEGVDWHRLDRPDKPVLGRHYKVAPEPLSDEARAILTGGRDEMMKHATSPVAGLDRPDREKIAKTIYADWGFGEWDKLMEAEKETWRKTADLTLATYEEEIRKLRDKPFSFKCGVCGAEMSVCLTENDIREVAKREEGERMIEKLREGGKLIWAFINKEKGKGNDASLLITVRDMVHDMVEEQALEENNEQNQNRVG